MSNLLKILKDINTPRSKSKFYKRFTVEGSQVGLVRSEVSEELSKYPEIFNISPVNVSFDPKIDTYEKRNEAVANVLEELRYKGIFSTLKGWRNESYDVKTTYDAEPLFKMDRSATCLFGIKTYGVILNGWVLRPGPGLCLWLQKRSAKKRWPGVWDNMVGGGITSGQGILECVHRESVEEASIPERLRRDIVSVGAVSCFHESDEGIFPNTAFVFDLRLPGAFKPENSDGEVDCFRLVTAEECLDIIQRGLFKRTVIMAALDFLVRHSVIIPEGNTHYLDIVEMLHIQLQKLYDQ